MTACCPISNASNAGRTARTNGAARSGPIGVEWARTNDPLYAAWIEAAKAAGYPSVQDYNARHA